MTSSNITLNFKTLRGREFTLTVPQNLSVPELQQRIADSEGVPIGRQRLIYQGKVLKADQTLRSYNIEDGDALHLIIRAEDAPPLPPASGSSSSAASSPSPSAPSTSTPPPTGFGGISFGPMTPLPGFPGGQMLMANLNVPTTGRMPDLNQLVSSVLSSIGIQTAPSQQQQNDTQQTASPAVNDASSSATPATAAAASASSSTASAASFTPAPPSAAASPSSAGNIQFFPINGPQPPFPFPPHPGSNAGPSSAGVNPFSPRPMNGPPSPFVNVNVAHPLSVNSAREALNSAAIALSTGPNAAQAVSASSAPSAEAVVPGLRVAAFEENLNGLMALLRQSNLLLSETPSAVSRIIDALQSQSSPTSTSTTSAQRNLIQRDAHQLGLYLRRLSHALNGTGRLLSHVAPQTPTNSAPLALSPVPVIPQLGPVERPSQQQLQQQTAAAQGGIDGDQQQQQQQMWPQIHIQVQQQPPVPFRPPLPPNHPSAVSSSTPPNSGPAPAVASAGTFPPAFPFLFPFPPSQPPHPTPPPPPPPQQQQAGGQFGPAVPPQAGRAPIGSVLTMTATGPRWLLPGTPVTGGVASGTGGASGGADGGGNAGASTGSSQPPSQPASVPPAAPQPPVPLQTAPPAPPQQQQPQQQTLTQPSALLSVQQQAGASSQPSEPAEPVSVANTALGQPVGSIVQQLAPIIQQLAPITQQASSSMSARGGGTDGGSGMTAAVDGRNLVNLIGSVVGAIASAMQSQQPTPAPQPLPVPVGSAPSALVSAPPAATSLPTSPRELPTVAVNPAVSTAPTLPSQSSSPAPTSTAAASSTPAVSDISLVPPRACAASSSSGAADAETDSMSDIVRQLMAETATPASSSSPTSSSSSSSPPSSSSSMMSSMLPLLSQLMSGSRSESAPPPTLNDLMRGLLASSSASSSSFSPLISSSSTSGRQDADDDDLSLLDMAVTIMTSHLSVPDMVAVMNGDLTAFDRTEADLYDLTVQVMDEQDTPELRAEAASFHAENISQSFLTSTVLSSRAAQLRPGADPAAVVIPILSFHLRSFIDTLMARHDSRVASPSSSLPPFSDWLRVWGTDVIGSVVDALCGCYRDGISSAGSLVQQMIASRFAAVEGLGMMVPMVAGPLRSKLLQVWTTWKHRQMTADSAGGQGEAWLQLVPEEERALWRRVIAEDEKTITRMLAEQEERRKQERGEHDAPGEYEREKRENGDGQTVLHKPLSYAYLSGNGKVRRMDAVQEGGGERKDGKEEADGRRYALGQSLEATLRRSLDDVEAYSEEKKGDAAMDVGERRERVLRAVDADLTAAYRSQLVRDLKRKIDLDKDYDPNKFPMTEKHIIRKR